MPVTQPGAAPATTSPSPAPRARRGRPPQFSRTGIVDAARELSAELGLDGLTMRALAERLGTTPATIYRHVPNHDALLAAVADSIVAETQPIAVSPDEPRAFLLAAAREYRRVMLRYPGVADYLLLRGPTGPHALQGMAVICDVLARTGLDAREVAWAYDWLMTTMSTYTSKEDRLNRAGGAPQVAEALNEIGDAHGDDALSAVLAQFTGDMEAAFERTTALVIATILDGATRTVTHD